MGWQDDPIVAPQAQGWQKDPVVAPAQKPIVAAVAPPPKTDISLGERFMGGLRQAWDYTVTGALGNFVDRTMQEDQARHLDEVGEHDAAARIRASIGVPQPSQVRYANAGAWNEPGTSLGEKILRGGTSLTANLVGAAGSPEGLIGEIGPINRAVAPAVERGVSKVAQVFAPRAAAVVERAAPAIGRTAAAATTQAAVQGATDLAVQPLNIAAGKQQQFDPMEVVEQTLLGGALGGVLHGTGEAKTAVANAFQDWRIKRDLAANVAPQPFGPPTQEEAAAFAQTPQGIALRNQILGPPPGEKIPPLEKPAEKPTAEPAQPPAADLRGRPIEPEVAPAVAPEPVVKPDQTSEPVAPEPVQPNPRGWETNPITEPYRPTEAPPAETPTVEPAHASAEAPPVQAEPPAVAPVEKAAPAPVAPAKAAKAPVPKSSTKAVAIVGGHIATNDAGHVMSDGGLPVKYSTKAQADKARDHFTKLATTQDFATIPHPDGKGYTVQGRAKELPVEGASGGATAGKPEPVRTTPPEAPGEAPKSDKEIVDQQRKLDADVKKAQEEGTVNAKRYDHEDEGEPTAPGQEKPARPPDEGTPQSGGAATGTERPADTATGKVEPSATGGEAGSAERGGGKGTGGTGAEPVKPAGRKRAGRSKQAEPAGGEGKNLTRQERQKVKDEFTHEKPGKRDQTKDLDPEFSNFKKQGGYPDTQRGTTDAIADYLLSRGEKTNHEALVLHDQASGATSHVETINHPLTVNLSNGMVKTMMDGSKDLVLHHNHPNSSALSDADIGVLAYPGMHWIVAHGHNGDLYAARLGRNVPEDIRRKIARVEKTRGVIEGSDAYATLRDLSHELRKAFRPYFQHQANVGNLTAKEATEAWAEAVMQALDRKGVIEYVRNKEFPAHVQDHINTAIDQNPKGLVGAADHRPTEPVGPDKGIDRVYSGKRERPAPGEQGSGGGSAAGTAKAQKLEAERTRLTSLTDRIEAHDNAELEAASKDDEGPGGTPREKVEANIDTRDEFYSEPVSNPEIWSNVSATLSSTFGWIGREAKAWVDEWKENFQSLAKGTNRPQSVRLRDKIYDKLAPVISMAEWVLKDKDGVLRSRATARLSPTLRKVADLFHAATEGMGARVTGAKAEDYHSAKYRWENKWKDQYGKATAFLAKLPQDQRNAALEQIGRLVQNPKNIVRGTPLGDAAHEITQIFKEAHTYLRAAGVDVGTVREGYLPRIENTEKILANQQGFLDKARQAYIASGIKPKDAVVAAQDWLERVTLGDYGVKPDGTPFGDHTAPTPSNFTRSRVLTKEADNIMGDFYHQNVRDIVPRYIRQAVGRAEWSRRFGVRDAAAIPPSGLTAAEEKAWREDTNGKWKDITADLIKEGNGDLVGVMAQIVRSMTGNFGAPVGAYGGWGTASVWLRTINILGKLSYSVLSSLAEPMSHAVQTGNVKDGITAYVGLVKHWVPALKKLGDAQYLHDLASDLNVIGNHWDESSALQLTGGESGNALADKLVEKFFRLTGQAQFTESSRVTSIGIGQTFLRRLANDVQSGNAYKTVSRRILQDFGVRDPDGFAKYVMTLDKPKASDLAAAGPHGEDYSLALQRYVQRTVMHPTSAMKPILASHPLGSMIFALQAFNYAFKKQVLDRAVLSAKAVTESGLTPQERAYVMMPMANMAAMALASYAIGELRDAALPDPAKADQEPMSEKMKWIRAVSRVGAFGYADPLVNVLSQARYQTDVNTALAGPILGPVGTALGAATDLGRSIVAPNEDEEDSNARSRRVATSAWDVMVRPAMQSAVTMGVPGGAGRLLAGRAFSYWLADRRVRAGFVDTVGGEKDE